MSTLSMISPRSLATAELGGMQRPRAAFPVLHDFRMSWENQASQNPEGPLRKKPGFHSFRDVKTEAKFPGRRGKSV